MSITRSFAGDRRANLIFNPRDYGALGDGINDDTAAFNAAHTAAAATGGQVYVPAGSYAVTSVAIKAPMYGAGESATLFYGSGNLDTLAVNVGGGTRLFNLTLSDFSVLAKTDQSAGAGLALDNVGYFKASRVTVSSAGGGKLYRPLRIDSGADLRFAASRFTQGVAACRAEVTSTAKNIIELHYDDLCEINSGTDNGIEFILSANSPASIEGVHIAATINYANGGHAIYTKNTGTGRLGSIRLHSNPNQDSNRKSGIYCENTNGAVTQDIDVINPWCSYNNNPGLSSPAPVTGPSMYFGPGCDNVNIWGGRVMLSGGPGIVFDGVKNGRVKGTVFANNGQGAGSGGVSTYYAMDVIGTSDDIEISDCAFVQDPNPARSGDPYKQNGIRVLATTTNVKVHDNDLTGLGTGTVAILMPIIYSGAATKWFEWNNKLNLTNERGQRTSGSVLIGVGGDYVSTYGLENVGGRAKFTAIATAVISSVVNVGAAGATGYWYWVTSEDRNGNKSLVSASVTTGTGNATLDGTNYNTITWAAVPGAARYYVNKALTSTFVAANCIAIVNANVGDVTLTANDQGQANVASISPPGRNATGDVTGDGYLAGTILGTAQSSTAVATATSGTIAVTTGVSRVNPAGAITGVILGTPSTVPAGFVPLVTVVNEAAAANTVTFAASGTSKVANGTSCVIAGLTAKTFAWDTGTSLWYPTS